MSSTGYLIYSRISKIIANVGTYRILEYFFYHDAALNTGKHSSFIMNLGSSNKYLQGFLLTSLEITSGEDTGLIQNKKPMTEAMEQTEVNSYNKLKGQTRSLEELIYYKL